jgi:pyruvate/2-oxoglutarate dehydrogenase complex dihydrolipoamide acyltransferase (E2) component
MEFESFNEGTLLYIGIEEGNTAPVDSLLAIIGPAGTDISVQLISKQMQKQKKVNQFQRAQNRIQQLLPGFCGSY